MAAWDDDNRRSIEWESFWCGIAEGNARPEWKKPGLSRKAWLGIAFGLYLSFMLGLAGWVLWKVAHPLPHILP